MRSKNSGLLVSFLVFWALALVACLPERPEPSPSSSRPTTLYSTVQPTLFEMAPIASETVLPPTLLPSSTPTKLPTVILEMPQVCHLQGDPVMADAQFEVPGTLAYALYGGSSEGVFVMEGNPTQTRLLVPWDKQSVLSPIGFSPNGKWFAYLTGSVEDHRPYVMHLVSAVGDNLTIPLDLSALKDQSVEGQWGFAYWINDERMLVYLEYSIPESPKTRRKAAVLDPFTGQWDQAWLNALPDRDPYGDVVFAPTKDRALYLSKAHPSSDLVLKDTLTEQILWQNHDLFRPYSVMPGHAAWSPDRAWLALNGYEDPSHDYEHEGIYVLDRDGKTLRLLTHFSETYESSSTSGLAWSPDGRYLAFIVLSSKAYPQSSGEIHYEYLFEIYLYDFIANQVVNLCPLYGDTLETPKRALVWSPDSRYIGYVGRYLNAQGPEQKPNLLVTISIYTGEAKALVEKAGGLEGWSDVFP